MKISTCAHLHILLYPYINSQIEFEIVREEDGSRLPFLASHTEPLFEQLYLLKVKDIFDVQCMKFWYKFVNKKLPNYFRDMFKYNHEVHDIGTRSHDQLHLYPTRTSGARNVLRHHIPELLNTFPKYLIDKIKTHSLYSISHHIKCNLVDSYSYDCSIIDCYICNNI